jgi:hypothetical protein
MKLATALWLCVGQFVCFFLAAVWAMVYHQPTLTVWVCFASAFDWLGLSGYLLYRWAKLTESLDVSEDDVRLTGYANPPVREMQGPLGSSSDEGAVTQDLPRLS